MDRGELKSSPLLELSDRINKVSEVVLFILISGMIGVTTMQVFCRFFLEALIWSEELTRFMLVAASLLGAAIAFKRGSHIAVTFLVSRLPAMVRKIVALLVQFIGIIFFFIVAYYGALLMKSESYQTTPAMGISMTWVYMIYPLIGSIILIHLIAGIREILRR
ncbi:MAG TPA: TRAP transporter small permease [Synergistales bacterium]|nr:TRAP transporter small permease [Synergistales bacterium]